MSICLKRGVLTVRALFTSRSPDECHEEHFKCQKPCSSLARRNAAYCQLNSRKSLWMCSTGGGGREAETSIHDRPRSQIIPLLLCSPETFQLLRVRQGRKVICAPCVRWLFHQTVVDWSGHDLCSWLLGTATAERQKARHHGNKTAGIQAGKIYWELQRHFHRIQAQSQDGPKCDANKSVQTWQTCWRHNHFLTVTPLF